MSQKLRQGQERLPPEPTWRLGPRWHIRPLCALRPGGHGRSPATQSTAHDSSSSVTGELARNEAPQAPPSDTS
ncbi:unnamed protein product [Rangifer tarandus platyrhynchus]|uniref:Uncharacterized protein n=1 Tax=Rangifer tarandus platyrhynchus TaxID=3082113 RepID=A0AC59Y515_RANTA